MKLRDSEDLRLEERTGKYIEAQTIHIDTFYKVRPVRPGLSDQVAIEVKVDSVVPRRQNCAAAENVNRISRGAG
jgi:hypothetical protein